MMPQKHCIVLPDPYGPDDDSRQQQQQRSQLLGINAELHRCLAQCKNLISVCGPVHGMGGAPSSAGTGLQQWSIAKRRTNLYELIHTGSRTMPGLSSHSPISRSFFKLWEILTDMGSTHLALDCDQPITAAFMAEGPGGFVESFAMWRAAAVGQDVASRDQLHCISLVSSKRSVPCWKLGVLNRAPCSVHVHAGADGTGDLYQIANIHSFVRACGGSGSCKLVTADGGFDFSNDFNAQEDNSLRLVISQVYAALLLQMPAGTLVLKLFDAASAETMWVLQSLSASYSAVRLVKPLSSRPANSERYVVCSGFRSVDPAVLSVLQLAVSTGSTSPISAQALASPPSIRFLSAVIDYNAVHIAHQTACIARTVVLASRSRGSDAGAVAQLLRLQLAHSMRWCHKYGIHVAQGVLAHYRTYFKTQPE